EEVRNEFRRFLCNDTVGENWRELLGRSRRLLADTVQGDGEAVAQALDKIRGEKDAPQFFDNEQSLHAIIKYAYISAFGQYLTVEEIPTGKGIADVAFLPTSLSRLPAMVVELKWNKTAGGAISQIKKKNYPAKLKPYAGNILLVGINYDEKAGKLSCQIEKARAECSSAPIPA
ncbi:MAG: PD-(D/E)XK nuclease domain-containing protein, partial [Clostridia bacterium]|nr:PD-(D/E)XK nuclease domain-containing protein [Clostridia bacterium]